MDHIYFHVAPHISPNPVYSTYLEFSSSDAHTSVVMVPKFSFMVSFGRFWTPLF